MLHRYIPCIVFLFAFTQCKKPVSHSLPPADPDNGGLLLPGNFSAVVVTQGIGPARHLAVNDNGDIYVKLTFNEAMEGRGGSVALRDKDGDGKADMKAANPLACLYIMAISISPPSNM